MSTDTNPTMTKSESFRQLIEQAVLVRTLRDTGKKVEAAAADHELHVMMREHDARFEVVESDPSSNES